jgi:hypothetical protein
MTPRTPKELATTDYADEAYEACMYGRADKNQQQSAASQIVSLYAKLDAQSASRYRAGLEAAARAHESVNPASDDERQKGLPGAGAMGAIIEYRDKIRALPTPEAETGK